MTGASAPVRVPDPDPVLGPEPEPELVTGAAAEVLVPEPELVTGAAAEVTGRRRKRPPR